MSDIVQSLSITVDDRDPQAIFDAMVSQWQAIAPDAVLRNGSLEAILMEAVAVATSDNIYALNRMLSIVVEAAFAKYGAPRDAGQPAAGTVVITLDGVRTGTIVAGTAMSAAGIDLTVVADVHYAAASSVTVPAACADAGAAGNSLAAGTDVSLEDAIAYAVSAQIGTGLSGGSDAESDAAYLARVGNVFARLTSALVLPEHLTAYALEDVRVGAATTIDLWDAASDATIGSDIGHATVVAHGRAGTLDAVVLDQLRAAMQAISSAAQTVHAKAATITTQNLALTVHPVAGTSPGSLSTAVETALRAWLSPLAWTFGDAIRVNEVIAIAAAVPGVDYVTTVATPSADVALPAFALAQAGTVTVTVT